MQGLNISKLFPWTRLVTLIIAAAALGYFIYAVDASLVGLAFVDALAVLPIVLVIAFFYFFLQTFAWQTTTGSKETSFWGLFTIKIGGYGLDRLAPFALVGGDPIQGHLLRKKFGILSGAESIVTDRSIQILATSLFVLIGLIVGFLNTPSLPIAIRIAIPVLAFVALIFFIISIRTAKSGFFGAVCSKTRSLGLTCGKSPAVTGTLEEADRLLLTFHETKRGSFYQALLLHLLSWGLLVAEVYLIGSALIAGFTVSWALLLTATAPLIASIFRFIPGGLAVVEGAFAGLLALAFGPPALVAGLALVLIRRTRALCWIIVGLALVRNPFQIFSR